LRLKAKLVFTPGVVVVDVPCHIGLADQGRMTQQVLPDAAAR
jgi:hypothetical protein